MSNLRGGASFLPETLAPGGIVGARADEFESYGAIEALVLSFENDTHAAFADPGKHAVRTNRVWERGQFDTLNLRWRLGYRSWITRQRVFARNVSDKTFLKAKPHPRQSASGQS
jgi:hypothetical protein